MTAPLRCPSASFDSVPHSVAAGAQYQFPDHSSHSKHYRGRYTSNSSEPTMTTTTEKPSLDFTQRIEKKLGEYNASDNVFKRWLFEMICWLVSASCMVVIILIYVRIRGQPVSEDGSFLTWTNTLGKVSSAALIVPTSEALGQLKWRWFHNSQAMWDFEIFDKACRGPLGAVMLLFRTRGRSLAALGALLIVLLLAIDTFFQQVVSFPDQWLKQHDVGLIPRVTRYEPFYTPETFQGYETNFVDPAFRTLLGQFFVDNGTQPVPFGNGTRPDIPLSCPTSVCDWPQYDTLGVCSECVQATNLLEFACLETKVDWSATHLGPISEDLYPNGTVCGYFLNSTSTAPVLMSGYLVNGSGGLQTDEALLVRTHPLMDPLTKESIFGGSINFKHIRYPMIDTLIVSATSGPDSVYRNETPIAQECVLTWCIKTVTSSYSWGQYSENIETVFMNTSDQGWPWPWKSYPVVLESENATMTIFYPNITITPDQSDSTEKVYGLSNTTASNIMIGFDDYFPSYYTAEKNEKPVLRYKNYPDGPSARKLAFNPLLAPNNVTHHMERLATAMTNVVRSSISKDMLPGHAFSTESVISVQWEWLIFPLLLLILSLVFLVSTIIKTSGDTNTQFWKTSTVPTLIYSLPEESRNQFVKSSTWKSKQETKQLRIKLLPNMGWRVSGASHLNTSPQLPRPAVQAPRGWI